MSMGVISVGNFKNRSWKASLLMISHVRKWILLQRTWQKKKILLLNFFPLHDQATVLMSINIPELGTRNVVFEPSTKQ